MSDDCRFKERIHPSQCKIGDWIRDDSDLGWSKPVATYIAGDVVVSPGLRKQLVWTFQAMEHFDANGNNPHLIWTRVA
jgi:hypothetical protein